MKKALVITMGLFVAVLAITSCGDSAADEARQKAIKDSLYNDSLMKAQAAAEQARIDSLAAVAAADSARAQWVRDSLAAIADKKGGKKPTGVKPQPTPPTPNTNNTTTTPAPDPKGGTDPKGQVKGGTSDPKGGMKGGTDGGSTNPKDKLKGGK